MRRKQRIAQGFRGMLGQKFVQDADVADRFRHLAAAEIEHAVVQPEAGEYLAAMGTGALGDFVLVVRELQIDAAGVDVDGFSQVGFTHRRAFDMPARAADTPGRVPARQIRRGRLPEYEVTRMAFVGGHFHACTGNHFIETASR